MFVVLLARGISWVNMGKTKQNKKKVREVPRPDPDAFWVPLYSFQFEFTFF